MIQQEFLREGVEKVGEMYVSIQMPITSVLRLAYIEESPTWKQEEFYRNQKIHGQISPLRWRIVPGELLPGWIERLYEREGEKCKNKILISDAKRKVQKAHGMDIKKKV